jgi:tetratricopeptide (TPR) repeat protein
MHPVERYQAVRQVLIDSDNMFGPTSVIGPCVKQIEAIQELRQQVGGEDRRRLLRLQADYAELAGWFHQDIGAHDRALYWTDRALQWSHGVQDSELTCFILARKAQLAADMGDGRETIEVAEAAEHLAGPGSRLEAIAATFGAHGHALQGTRDATMRAYDHVHELLSSLNSDSASSWGVWLDDAYVDVAQYRSLAHLGDYAIAAEGFDRAIGDLPTGFHRDRGVYLARAARAHAGNGNADHAAMLGAQALAIGIETTSGRILTELASLDDTIKSVDNPAVAEFHDAMSSTLVHQA